MIDEDDEAMMRAMAKFGAIASADEKRPARPDRGSSPKARKQRAQKLRRTVDGRSLRATGRTKQFNFSCRPEIHQAASELAGREGVSLAEFMESLVENAMRGAR